MNADEVAGLIPGLLGDLYPGKFRPATGEAVPDYPGGWILEEDGAFCFMKAAGTKLPFIWIRVGAGPSISRQFPASVQDVVRRLDFCLEHARDLQYSIFERWGGRRFAGDDWMYLVPDLEGTVLEKRPST